MRSTRPFLSNYGMGVKDFDVVSNYGMGVKDFDVVYMVDDVWVMRFFNL